MKPEQIIKHYDRLKTKRQTWESGWQDVTDLVLPRKNDVYLNKNATKGEIKTTLYDASAPHYNELLAATLHSTLTNPSLPFFELSSGDYDLDQKDAVRKFMQKSQRILHNILNNSNFQTEIHEVYLDLGSLGTTVLCMEEDDDIVIRFMCKPIFEGYIDENSKGVIDTVYRVFKYTIRQIVQKWGEQALTDKMRRLYEADPLEEIELIHAVYPREEEARNPKKGGKGKAFASKYIVIDEAHLLSEGGYDEFPYAVPRWTKTSGEIYGRSPSMKALPDIRMINAMKKTTIRSAQKVTDPPMQAPDDGIAMPIKTNPNALNYYRRGSKDRIEPILTGGRVDFGFQTIEELKRSIKEAYFIDRLHLREGDRMTTVEVNQRTEENLRVLAPLLGRLGSELLTPIIARVFGAAERAGLLPEIPPELANSTITIKYSSMIAKAQRVQEGQNLNRALQDVAPILQSNPQVLDIINGDVALKNALRLHGVSEELIRGDREVAQNREAKAKMLQEQQRMQEEQHMADVAQKTQGMNNVQ